MNDLQLALIAKREIILIALAGTKKTTEKLDFFIDYALTYLSPNKKLKISPIKKNRFFGKQPVAFNVESRFKLNDDYELLSEQKVDGDVEQLLKEQFKSLNIPKTIRFWTLIGLALALLFLFPIKQSNMSDGHAFFDGNSVQISARSSGVVSRLMVKAGRVKKRDVVAKLANTNVVRVREIQTQLALMKNKIIEQGAYSTTDMNGLLYERKRLEALLERLKEDVANDEISSPASGLIEWERNVLGMYVQKGQVIGSVNPEKQFYVTALVNLNDWVGSQYEDDAGFIADRSLKKIKGKIVSIGKSPSLIDSKLMIRVVVKLVKEVKTGSSGSVVLYGKWTTLGFWLFQKQIVWLRAKW